MEDLRLILVNFDAGLQQAGIEIARGELGNIHVRAAGEDEPDTATVARDADEGAPQAVRGQEIGADDAHVPRVNQVVAQPLGKGERFETLMMPHWAVALKQVVAAGQETLERPVTSFGEIEELVEGRGEFGDERGICEPRADVAPAGGHAVAIVFVGDIEAADEGDMVVADEQLAVVADGETPEGEAVETADVRPGGAEGVEVIFRQCPGTKAVHEHANADAAFNGGEQGISEEAS